MKKFTIVLIFLMSIVFLGGIESFADEYVCIIELHSFTETEFVQTYNITNDDLVEPQLSISGHSYVVFENISNSTIIIGHYSLAPNQKVSVGLWQTGSIGSSSSSSGSSSGSSEESEHNGVYYNLERYKFGKTENPKNDVHITANVTKENLQKATDRMNEKNNSYNVLTYNCSALAVDLWNRSTGDNLSAGWINTPDYLRTNIINHKSYDESTDLNIGRSSTFCYYSTKSNQMVYYY